MRALIVLSLFIIARTADARPAEASDAPTVVGTALLGSVVGGVVFGLAGAGIESAYYPCPDHGEGDGVFNLCFEGLVGFLLGGSVGLTVGGPVALAIYDATGNVEGSPGSAALGSLLGAAAAFGLAAITCDSGTDLCVVGGISMLLLPGLGAGIGYIVGAEDPIPGGAVLNLDGGGLQLGVPRVSVGRRGADTRMGVALLGGSF